MKTNYCAFPFSRAEADSRARITATYLASGMSDADCLKKTGGFAVGQSVGTWIEVPGISQAMIEQYQARVEAVYPAGTPEERSYILRVSFPAANFGDSFTMMLTSLVGNDVSTALAVRLLDLDFSAEALRAYRGPAKDIRCLRELTGAVERPLVLNMIKPCLGYTPQEGAKLFYEAALGGVDLIKDDELLGSPTYNAVAERARLYGQAEKAAFEKTGKHVCYLPNISGRPSQVMENAKAVIDAGQKACLFNFLFSGLDTLRELCDAFGDQLFIMGHYAGFGAMSWPHGGIANAVMLGLLPRLAGADAVMTMRPSPADESESLLFRQTLQAQTLPLPGIRPLIPTYGGGITPVNQAEMQKEVGIDSIIGIGGAVQGHPMGTAAGGRAAIAAVDASAHGIPLQEAAKSCEPLAAALKLWA